MCKNQLYFYLTAMKKCEMKLKKIDRNKLNERCVKTSILNLQNIAEINSSLIYAERS